MFQEERSIFSKVRVSIIVREKVYMNMSRILGSYRNGVVYIYKCKSISSGNKEKLLNILF